jgi:hypothetical protein
MVEVDLPEADVEAELAPQPEPAPEPEPEPDEPVVAEVEPDVEPADTDVNALFARLRAEREAAEPEPNSEPEPEPVEPAADIEADDSVEVDEAQDREDGASVLTLLERRDAVTDELERNLARRIKRVLGDEQNAVLDAVRRARKLPSPGDVGHGADPAQVGALLRGPGR